MNMGMRLEVASGVLATVIHEANRASPHECCGLLMGTGNRIEQAVPAANVASDPARHFELDPAALITALRHERDGGPRVIGYYHSHPNGLARPSSTDVAQAAHDGRVWAIMADSSVSFWLDSQAGFVALSYMVFDG